MRLSTFFHHIGLRHWREMMPLPSAHSIISHVPAKTTFDSRQIRWEATRIVVPSGYTTTFKESSTLQQKHVCRAYWIGIDVGALFWFLSKPVGFPKDTFPYNHDYTLFSPLSCVWFFLLDNGQITPSTMRHGRVSRAVNTLRAYIQLRR